MSRIEKRPITRAEEQDVHTPWRRLLVLRRGEVKAVKRRSNKRARRARKNGIGDSW